MKLLINHAPSVRQFVPRLFFYLTILFLPIQLGYHFWPDWAMVLGRRVDYLSPTLYLTDILVFFMLLSWFTQYCKSIKGLVLRIKDLIPKILITKYSILLILFVGLNILYASSKPVAIYKWLKILEFMAFGWYIIRTKPSLSFIAYPLSLGILYSSAIALTQFFLQHSVGGLLWWLGERTFDAATPGIALVDMQFSIFHFPFSVFRLRPYATLPHPNVLGGFLAAALPLVILQYSKTPILQLAKKTFFLLTLVFGFTSLFLTFSRSAWVAGILGLSITCYVLWRKQKVFLPLMVVAVFFILLTTTTFRTTDESFIVRQQLNNAAIQQWITSPIFGVGLGNFLVELPRVLPEKTIYFLQPVHNIYLLVLAETGVVGLSFFLWLLWKAAMKVWGGQNFVLRFKKNSFIIYHLSFIILLILGLADHYPATLQQGQLLLTLFLSLSLSAVRRESSA